MFRRPIVILLLGVGLVQPMLAARELSDDELRMKEQLIALSQGEGSVADLQIELTDGSPMQTIGTRIYTIADGKVISQEWDAPGSPEKRAEWAVTDDGIRNLLRELVTAQYWTFRGTEFTPDADEFMFRIHYKNLPPIEYRCQAHEYRQSQPFAAIRSVLLAFIKNKK